MALSGTATKRIHDEDAHEGKRERPLRLMRLRAVLTADFRKNEMTNYVEACERFPQLKELGPHDVVAFHSQSGGQVVFVHGFLEVEPANGRTRRVLRSERVRLTDAHASWSELMIADYAERVGIRLEGIKKFAEHMIELRKGLEEMWKQDQPAMAKRAEETKAKALGKAKEVAK